MIKNLVVIAVLAALVVAMIVPDRAVAQSCPIAVAASVDGLFNRRAESFQRAMENVLAQRGAVIPQLGSEASAIYHASVGGRAESPALTDTCQVVIANIHTNRDRGWTSLKATAYTVPAGSPRKAFAVLLVPNLVWDSEFGRLPILEALSTSLVSQLF